MQANTLNLRKAFSVGTSYLGIDRIAGPGVDEIVDLLDSAQVEVVRDHLKPSTIICLYVLEHVWDIQGAARALGALWSKCPNAWLLVSTHQNQPYHGHGPDRPDLYDDFWRLTPVGMRRLLAESGVPDVHLLLWPDALNPEDIVAIRQPLAIEWPSAAVARSLSLVGHSWINQ